MIEQIEIAGRKAVVAYLTDDFTPTAKDAATMVPNRPGDGAVPIQGGKQLTALRRSSRPRTPRRPRRPVLTRSRVPDQDLVSATGNSV